MIENGKKGASPLSFSEKINGILQNAQYMAYMAANAKSERERLYCRHHLAHALDVARVCYILCLENGFGPAYKDAAYAAGLLHDVGRFREAADSFCDHAAESARLSEPILNSLPFGAEEKKIILAAILHHREAKQTGFGALLYEADKISRPCFDCAQIAACKRHPDGILRY